MVDLTSIPVLLAHPDNYSSRNKMQLSRIKFVVMHYTSNINDTAMNNAKYFKSTVTKSSAHFFVDAKEIVCSVPIDYVAYSVGLGSMSKPYIKNPAYYRTCLNTNSISIEMCGSRNSREADITTKDRACELAASLMSVLNVPMSHLIRHYDVTGKNCPAWAVEDPMKWLDLQLGVEKYLQEDETMVNNETNYQVFKEFMERYFNELSAVPASWEADTMDWAQKQGLIKDGRPKSYITRGEFATVLQRLFAHEK